MIGAMYDEVKSLQKKIQELEAENTRLKKLLQDIQNPIRDDFDDWYFSYADDCY